MIAFFANAALVVPGLDAASLPGSEQRYGIDQDGNAVLLVATGVTVPVVAPPPSFRGERYGINQNGERVALADVPAAVNSTVVAATAAPVELALKTEQPSAAAQTPASSPTLLRRFLAAVGRGERVLLTGFGFVPAPHGAPAPATSAVIKSASTAAVMARPGEKVTTQGAILPARKELHKMAAHAAVSAVTSGDRPSGVSPRVATGPSYPSSRYSLKIDSFKIRSSVRPVEEKLARNGVAIMDSRNERTSQIVHRLVVGTFATEEQAKNRLRAVTPVVKNAYIMGRNGSHGVYCGSYYKLQKAREKVAELKRSGIRVAILHDSVEIRRTTILAGSFISRDAARDISLRLRRMGIPAAIVPERETLSELNCGPKREKPV